MTIKRLALLHGRFLSYIKCQSPENHQIVIWLCKNIAAAQHYLWLAKSTVPKKIDAAHYPGKMKG